MLCDKFFRIRPSGLIFPGGIWYNYFTTIKKDRRPSMARRRLKRKQTNFILTLAIILLAVLTLCTLFMPMLRSSGDIAGYKTSDYNVTGADIVSAAFTDKTSSGDSYGKISLVSMKNSDDNKFVAIVFIWSYLIAMVAAAVVGVLAILSLIRINLRLINALAGVVLMITSLVAFIFAFIAAGKFGSLSIGSLVSVNTVAAVGNYILLAGLVCGITSAYKSRN